MTKMAQQIDEDNRKLMKTNQELKINFLSQVDDRDLLLKQIIFHKRQNAKLKEVHTHLTE